MQGGKLGAFLKFENNSVSLRFKTAVGDKKEGTGRKGRDRES